MVKPLTFKGDKKSTRKRKRPHPSDQDPTAPQDSTAALTTTTPAAKPSSSSAADASTEDDTWVPADTPSDISGPVIIVLPTIPPSCLASDAAGKVFPLPVENIVDSDPSTAEPHDVRQVWVANRVAGSEAFSFRGAEGRYLGCDKFGILSAAREAVGPEEGFVVVPVADMGGGCFGLQNARERFVAVGEEKGGVEGVRGDCEVINYSSTVRIRMQARFKPRHRVAKEEKAREKISRKELEGMVGRRLEDEEVRLLKRARREGDFHEKLLDVKVKGKHDKFA